MMKYILPILIVLLISTSCKNDKKPITSATQKAIPALTESEIVTYKAKGKAIASASFKALSGNLKKAMKKGGPSEAIQFCQSKAGSLVDSLMKAHDATIKRTSTHLRNPANKPTLLEQEQLNVYEEATAAGQPVSPLVVLTENNNIQFFAPIKMKAVCLKCHGVAGKTTQEKDLALIKKYYPTDNAMGYQEGDFRGMWSIQFNR